MFLVDSHCHLDGLDYQSLHKDVDDVLAKAAARDVKFCLAVATTLPGYRSMRELVGERDNVVFSCGVHPLNQDETYDVEDLRRFAAEEGVVAMGETGLDYFYTPETKVRQQESFIHHIRQGPNAASFPANTVLPAGRQTRSALDRKSTRLNSSH